MPAPARLALPAAAPATLPARLPLAARPAPRPRCTAARARRATCRAATAETAASGEEQQQQWAPDFGGAASSGGGGGGNGSSPLQPLPKLEDALQASTELVALCRLQLQILTTSLQLSLQAALAGSLTGSMSLDEDDVRQQLLHESTCFRASVYCRAPGSLQSGTLQLQLVATSEEGDAAGGGGGGGAAQQPPAQRFLFLGQKGAGGGSSLHEQEQWILEQQVIVLPDSGGLVLPLSHNAFLVGLLVVERCLDEGSGLAPSAGSAAAAGQAAAAAAAAAAAESSGASSGAGSGDGAAGAMPQAPACLLFRATELQLLKQTAAVLSLACAMDMRAALERVGAAVRQRQASALVQAAKRPLSMMRTLGTMLLPRLQPGEPDRDFAQGILEQGTRLQEVVSQLQAALHPGAASMAVPPALQAGAGSSSSGSNGGSSGGNGARPGSPGTAWQLAPQAPPRPALPSSSIGGDYVGELQGGGATIDMTIDADEASAGAAAAGAGAAPGALQPSNSSSSSGGSSWSSVRGGAVYSSRSSGSNGADVSSSSSSSSSSSLALSSSGGAAAAMSSGGSRASADLLNVLMPLLASASNFAAVNGVSFMMAEHGGGGGTSGDGSSSDAAAAGSSQPLHMALPASEVAVGPGTLKRMLSQLVDGVIACAVRGDLVQASVQPQAWQGRPGVAVALCCCYGLAHGTSSGGDYGPAAAPAAALPRPPLQLEFAFLESTAQQAGGWFEVRADATPDVAHATTAAATATLWLPTVTRDAGWTGAPELL